MIRDWFSDSNKIIRHPNNHEENKKQKEKKKKQKRSQNFRKANLRTFLFHTLSDSKWKW